MNETLIRAALLLLSMGHLGWAAGIFKPSLEAMNITGQVQVQYADYAGRHVLSLDNRHYFPQNLPADAEIAVLRGDALFSCGGARISALPGTIFTTGEWDGMDHIVVKEGELTVKIGSKLTVLDESNRRFTFIPSANAAPLSSPGFLR